MPTTPSDPPADHHRKLAILVGGGPAPGINSVIGAATIRAGLEGIEVLGIQDGFEWIMRGDIDHVRPLGIDEVSRIHFRGGSYIGISRANPTTDPALMHQAISSLLRLNVSQLLTIGGDDTAFSAMQLAREAAGRIRVVHVPKTIDNDLDLPMHVDTFGYQSARHHGCEVVKHLMADARTTSRWYLVVTMGRKAGHLALGIGKAAGATLTLIPEEFGAPFRLKTLVDTLVGAIIKRLAEGRRFGVAVMAEGLVLGLAPEDVAALDTVDRDAHGHVQLDDINLGDMLKDRVTERLATFGIKMKLSTKKVGFELRCVDPIPVDMEYARDLGYCAAKYLLDGGSGVMVSIQGGQFVPIPFSTLEEGSTGRARVRLVDITSARYAIARRYMIRLRRDDFSDPHELAKLAAAANLSEDEFRREFESLVASEPPPLTLERYADPVEEVIDPTPPPATPAGLFARLDALGISHVTHEHPPLFTVEQSKELRGELPGTHCKNLFLRDKKGRMWLVVTFEDRAIDLKALGGLLGGVRLSFGSADRLMRTLGVTPGAVTPFAVINDHQRLVTVVLDREMMQADLLNYHPLSNEMTTAITPADLLTFLRDCGREPEMRDLSGLPGDRSREES